MEEVSVILYKGPVLMGIIFTARNSLKAEVPCSSHTTALGSAEPGDSWLDSSRTWHPFGTGFAGMKDARLTGSQNSIFSNC